MIQRRYDNGGWRCGKFPYGRGLETEYSNPGVTLPVLDHWTGRKPIGRVVIERPHRKLTALRLCGKELPSILAARRYGEVLENLKT